MQSMVGQRDVLLGWTGLSLRVNRLRCLGVFGGQAGQFNTLLVALVDCVSQLVQVAMTQSTLQVVHLSQTNSSVYGSGRSAGRIGSGQDFCKLRRAGSGRRL